jgi:fido (protein-threonine AMPylation protein)
LEVLGEPVLKAAQYDIEQTVQDRVDSALLDKLRSGTLTLGDVLTDRFVRELHRRLYGDVWEWGGRFRLLQTNIGIAPEQIAVQLRSEMDNLRYRWEHVHDLGPRLSVRGGRRTACSCRC